MNWGRLFCLYLPTNKIFPMQWMLQRSLTSLVFILSANVTGIFSPPFPPQLVLFLGCSPWTRIPNLLIFPGTGRIVPTDIKDVFPPGSICLFFTMADCFNSCWCNMVIHFRYIQSTCATSGEGLYEGLEWLSNNIASKASTWTKLES